MAYIGRPLNSGNTASEQLTGNNGASYSLANSTTDHGVVLSLDGVVQKNGVDFNITGTALTFTSNVPTGVKINVTYIGLPVSIGTPGDASVTTASIQNNAVDSAQIASGAVDDAHISGIAGNKLTGTVTAKGDGSSTVGKLLINCEQNSHGITIQSPAHSAAANYTLTLPVNDGSPDEILKTDGSGVLSWTTDSGGGPSLGTNHIIRTNAKTISENITFAGTENGLTIGPVTISSGNTVTVTSGSTWTIV